MKIFKYSVLGLIILSSFASNATETDLNKSPNIGVISPAPAPTTEGTKAKESSWADLVQKKYNLTEAQMEQLKAARLPDPHFVRVAHLSQLSGKSIEEILKMRSEKKMGWGQITKELGVSEKELGQSVADLRRERNEERKKLNEAKSKERKEKRDREMAERKEKHNEMKKEHKERMESKKQAHADKKADSGKPNK